jgi:hypothetical protein
MASSALWLNRHSRPGEAPATSMNPVSSHAAPTNPVSSHAAPANPVSSPATPVNPVCSTIALLSLTGPFLSTTLDNVD